MDVRRLLQGEKVAFIKSRDNWRLSLQGLLDSGNSGSFEGEESDNNGVSYTGYLKLLLFLSHSTRQYYRLMDVIQMNLRTTDSEFCMTHCVYGAEIRGKGRGKHFFFGVLEPAYTIEVRTEKAY